MNHRMKKAGKWVGVFVIAAIFAAGGIRMASKEESTKSGAMSEETYSMAEGEAAMEDTSVAATEAESEAMDTAEVEVDSVEKESGSTLYEENPEQKMIVTWDISIETEQYKKLIEQITKTVKERKGYIESESEQTENSLTSEGAAAEDSMEYEEAEKAMGMTVFI